MKEGKNQYAPSYGIHSLKQSIQNYQKKYYDLNWSDDEIIITAGATESLFDTFNAFLNDGDEVILFEPFYDSYLADIKLAGGVPKVVTLHKPDFSFNYNELEQEITEKTKLIVLNNPHNPTGKVYSYEELEFISKLAIKNNLIVVSDEVYEFLTFDDKKHIPIATLPNMKERTITISSAGKTFGFTGWKIGFSLAKKEFIDAIHSIHQWTTFAVNTPAQHSVAKAFLQLDDYLPKFKAMYQRKRDLVLNGLLNSNFKAFKPNGSYFIMAEYPKNIFNDDLDAAMKLIKNYSVATIPPSVFYSKSDEGKTMLRICFAKTDETLLQGLNNLKKVN
jgi:N-succinyldiaminopimelate aminotransferase